MKSKELMKQLEAVQRNKSKLKQLIQQSSEQNQHAFDLIHQIETGIQVILLELYKGKKK